MEETGQEPPVLADLVRVTVSRDRLRALADFQERPPAHSGFAPTAKELIELLRQQGIRYGLVGESVLQEVLDTWIEPLTDVVVAIGRAPTASKPETCTLQFDPDPPLQLAQREDGSVDYRELGIMQTAVAGQVLAIKTPAVLGDPGTDVRNRPLLPVVPKPVALPAGKGTQISADGLTLLAAIDGQLLYGHDRRVTVAPIYYVKENVDFSTGNIDFIGSVVVRGNVQSGFTVKAEHNIEVYGIVEAANITAGGDVVIRGGVQGSLRTCVEAGGNMRALYLQNATVHVGGELLVADSVMHSRIQAKTVRVAGKRGLLVGGQTAVTDSLYARVIGSHLSTETPITIGYFPSPHERLQTIDRELAALEAQLQEREAALLRMRVYGHVHRPALVSATEQGNELREAIEQLRVQSDELLEERLHWEEIAQQPEPYVQIGSVAYPGVRLKASVATKYIEEITRPCKYVLGQARFERVMVQS